MKGIDFYKQPKTKAEEIEYLKNLIWFIHITSEQEVEGYKEMKVDNEYHWLLLYTVIINDIEKVFKVKLSSGWYHNLREYIYLPEAWNSLPFKLKIDRDWGLHI